MGHECCGEVLDQGAGCTARFPPGTLVVGPPYVTGPLGAEYVGYFNRLPGGFGERMVLTESMLFAGSSFRLTTASGSAGPTTVACASP